MKNEKTQEQASAVLAELRDLVDARISTLNESLNRRLTRPVFDDHGCDQIRVNAIRTEQKEIELWAAALEALACQDPISIIVNRPNLTNIFHGWKPAVLEADIAQQENAWARLAAGGNLK